MYKKVKSYGTHVVEMEASRIGNDFNISIYRGSRPHIGEAAVATYNRRDNDATVVGLTAGKIEESIAHKAAKYLAVALKGTVCVTCGLYCGEIAKEEAKILGSLVDELLDNIKVEFAR